MLLLEKFPPNLLPLLLAAAGSVAAPISTRIFVRDRPSVSADVDVPAESRVIHHVAAAIAPRELSIAESSVAAF